DGTYFLFNSNKNSTPSFSRASSTNRGVNWGTLSDADFSNLPTGNRGIQCPDPHFDWPTVTMYFSVLLEDPDHNDQAPNDTYAIYRATSTNDGGDWTTDGTAIKQYERS